MWTGGSTKQSSTGYRDREFLSRELSFSRIRIRKPGLSLRLMSDVDPERLFVFNFVFIVSVVMGPDFMTVHGVGMLSGSKEWAWETDQHSYGSGCLGTYRESLGIVNPFSG